jgi:dTDP-N-acetylfucosamine:lipid II N-acetylfucosaminyltransferase
VDADPRSGRQHGHADAGIVHILNDGWFMEVTGWAFELAAPGANTFVALGFDPSEVNVPSTATVVGIANDREGRKQLEALVAGSRIAIFHSVSQKLAGILASAPPSVLRVWSGWGGDYYGSTYDHFAGQLGPRTRKLVHGAVRPTYWAGRALRALRVGPALHGAAKSSDVFSAPIPEDLAVFTSRFPKFAGRYSQLNYAIVEDSIVTPSGRDILLGNSASPTNNHLDVLERLSAQNLGGRRVIAPLSYGDPGYALSVARAGKEMLGDAFVPLMEFLPLDEYNEMLAGCGIVVMGHRRQEGLGNVLRALWQGSALVFDSRNPIVRHLRSHGVDVEVLDELGDGGFPDVGLSAQQRQARQLYLSDNWSRAAVLRNVRALVALAPSP